ncbi:helix-turn-helix domain-containing protein [Thalassotalea sp. Y01]|uniref:AraC family transcriptional regulator n=1 Tax=Thalassotalea sp. Y01 TaxID=2729613 RepID=UPI00145DD521|nr:helix-turn-helix domain-containing protein [Thalassotalea sp. Y01]NMP16913.1 AraC family transcriptional regulator [Thalassotalea sp. Y01]
MSTIIFNLHDLILAATALLCILASVFLFAFHKHRSSSFLLLALFLLSHGLIAIHELTYYGIQFRYTVLETSPNLFFIGSFAYVFDALLFYWYVTARTGNRFSFAQLDYRHFLPFFIYLVYMLSAFYLLDDLEKTRLVHTWKLTESWHYVYSEAAIKMLRLIYLLAAWTLFSRYLYSSSVSQEKRAEAIFLKWLILIFAVITFAEVVLSSVKVIDLYVPIDSSVLSFIGVSGYYLTFLFVVAMISFAFARLIMKVQARHSNTAEPKDTESDFKPDFVTSIETLMREQRPYLDTEISIETLSNQLGISSKELSITLNRHFQMNFYEYVNKYRIEAAKALLIDEPERSITEIFYDVGFNSKSVFNTCFKKFEGMTPSQYRKSVLNTNVSLVSQRI